MDIISIDVKRALSSPEQPDLFTTLEIAPPSQDRETSNPI
jgi:hypothetical protein